MPRFALVAVLACACDGVGSVASDAPIARDASQRGLVRVRVSGEVERAGLTVYFQERDSTLALATRTNAAGEATGLLGPDGFVTLVVQTRPVGAWTYTGVQPGDVLDVHEPTEGIDTGEVDFGFSVFIAAAAVPPIPLKTPCGAFTMQALAEVVPLGACPDVVDLLLFEDFTEERYQFARAVDLRSPSYTFDGVFAPLETSPVKVTNVPPGFTLLTHQLVANQVPLFRVNDESVHEVITGLIETSRELPRPDGATIATELTSTDPREQHVIDWRPARVDTAFDFSAVTMRSALVHPRYEPSRTSLVWSETSGQPGNLVHARLNWEADGVLRNAQRIEEILQGLQDTGRHGEAESTAPDAP